MLLSSPSYLTRGQHCNVFTANKIQGIQNIRCHKISEFVKWQCMLFDQKPALQHLGRKLN